MKTTTKQSKNVVSVDKLLLPKALPKAWRDAAGLLSRSAKANLAELKKNRTEWDKRTHKLETLLRKRS